MFKSQLHLKTNQKNKASLKLTYLSQWQNGIQLKTKFISNFVGTYILYKVMHN